MYYLTTIIVTQLAVGQGYLEFYRLPVRFGLASGNEDDSFCVHALQCVLTGCDSRINCPMSALIHFIHLYVCIAKAGISPLNEFYSDFT